MPPQKKECMKSIESSLRIYVNIYEYSEQLSWISIVPLDWPVSTLEAYVRLCC